MPQAPADAEGPLLRTALELCQDTEYPVRVAMCQQLPAVSKAISRELVGAGLLDETLELLRDEEAQVGAGAAAVQHLQMWLLSCMPVSLSRAAGCVQGRLPAVATTSTQYSAGQGSMSRLHVLWGASGVLSAAWYRHCQKSWCQHVLV
jgi:hypothetical protein